MSGRQRKRVKFGFSVVGTPDQNLRTPSAFHAPRPRATPGSTATVTSQSSSYSQQQPPSRFGQYVNAELQRRLQRNAAQLSSASSTNSRASRMFSVSPDSTASFSSVDLTSVTRVLSESVTHAAQSKQSAESKKKSSGKGLFATFAPLVPHSTPQSLGAFSLTPSTRPTPRNSNKRKATSSTPLLRSVGTGNANSTASERSQVVMCLANLRNKELIGVAAFDFTRASLTLYQYRDTITFGSTLRLLSKYDPLQILLSETCNNGPLHQAIQAEFDMTPIELVGRKHFNENRGLQFLESFCRSAISIDSSKYLCLASTACLMNWIRLTQNVSFASHSIPVQFKSLDGHMVLDYNTIRNLELVYSLDTEASTTGVGGGSIKRRRQTLLAVMNHCNTRGGTRQLRGALLEPLTSVTKLTARYELISELLEDEDTFFELNGILRGLSNADRLCAAFVLMPNADDPAQCHNTILNILVLKNMLEALPKLATSLQRHSSPLVAEMIGNFRSSTGVSLLSAITEFIEPSAAIGAKVDAQTGRGQIAFAIKTGVNGFLDVARANYVSNTESIQKEASGLRDRLQCEHLKLKYTPQRGFHLAMKRDWFDKHASSLTDPQRADAPLFIEVVTRKKQVFCTTSALASFNARQNESYDEIVDICTRIVQQLLVAIRQSILWLFTAIESIGFLDLMMCFANLVVLNPDYCKPQLTQNGPIAIKGGRHPIIECTRLASGSDRRYVPNDCYLTPETRLHVVSGPNGSGKSCYIKMVGCLTIMAMCGSFVPASFASFRVTDTILTRMTLTSALETQRSTFCEELREVRSILESLVHAKAPLVLVDELGRSTSTVDGVGIAWAVCEELIQSQAYTLCVSHFQELAQLESLYAQVKLCHMAVVKNHRDKRLGYTHELQDGFTPDSKLHYGIYACSLTSIPEEMLKYAMNCAKQLTSDAEERRAQQATPIDARTYCSLFAMLKLVQQKYMADGEEGSDIVQIADALGRLAATYISPTSPSPSPPPSTSSTSTTTTST